MFGCLGLLQDPASAAENFGNASGTARLIFTPLTPHITHISHATSPITALKAGSFFFHGHRRALQPAKTRPNAFVESK